MLHSANQSDQRRNDIPVPEEVQEDASLREIWDELTDRERECWVGGHKWYYDTCERCGARKHPAEWHHDPTPRW